MEVRPGYKQTEIGVIPDDWQFRPISDLARLESGHTPSKRFATYWNGDISWVSLHDTEILDRNFISDTSLKITELGIARSSARLLPAGTVVFSRTATVGKATIIDRTMATSQDFANYICGPLLCNLFLVYLFRWMRPVWQSLMAGSIHNTIYMPSFERLKIVVPPVHEQRAIAEALSDVDAAIGALSRLIAKKRDLRTGAMQRLLTGQTRLPGFTAPWKVKRLGDHVSFLRNGVQSRAQLTLNDPVRYLHYGDIHVAASMRLDLRDAVMPRIPTAAAARLSRVDDGDVVFVDASEDLVGVGKSVEIVGAKGIEAVAGQHTIAARFDKEVLADGFKGYLQFVPAFITHLRRLAAGTKVYATNRKHIASAEIALPEPDEQTAIARVLSDMNAEIAAFEARLAKIRALKQAMMQALLTGRVRLPVATGTEPELEAARA